MAVGDNRSLDQARICLDDLDKSCPGYRHQTVFAVKLMTWERSRPSGRPLGYKEWNGHRVCRVWVVAGSAGDANKWETNRACDFVWMSDVVLSDWAYQLSLSRRRGLVQ